MGKRVSRSASTEIHPARLEQAEICDNVSAFRRRRGAVEEAEHLEALAVELRSTRTVVAQGQDLSRFIAAQDPEAWYEVSASGQVRPHTP